MRPFSYKNGIVIITRQRGPCCNANMLFLRPGEKDEVKPSVEVASKITDALELSLDFLVGKMNVEIERRSLKRLQDIQKLNKQDKGAQVVQEISSQ